MTNPKRWKKRRRNGLNVPRVTSRATMVISSVECMDTRNNSWIPTMSQGWSITFPMLFPMGASTLKMMKILYIGWRSRVVYLRMCLTIKYIIGRFCTWKNRNRIQVKLLVSCKNRGPPIILMWFSLFSTPINCIAVFT